MATATPTPGDDRRREMSPDEKLIAQWEAQHDVAARGHRGDPLGLQRSISRERLADCARRTATAAGTGREAAAGSTASGSTASRSAASGGTAARPAVDRATVDRVEDTDWSAVCAVPPPSLPPASSSEPPPEPAPGRRPWWRLRHHTSQH